MTFLTLIFLDRVEALGWGGVVAFMMKFVCCPPQDNLESRKTPYVMRTLSEGIIAGHSGGIFHQNNANSK